MKVTRTLVLAASVALLAGCGGGGPNSVEQALEQLQTASSDEERQEAIDYLMQNAESAEDVVVPAPITVEFNEPVDVTGDLRGEIDRQQFADDLAQYDGDPRVIRVSADVTNTSGESLAIPEWGVGFDAYEGAGQFPVDSYAGYMGYEDITGVERMPTLIQPGETVEFAQSFMFTMDDNWRVNFEWSDEQGSASAIATFEAP